MKVLFEHNDHQIILTRGVVTSELTIDAALADTWNGFTNNQTKAFTLSGMAVNADGTKDPVKVTVNPSLFHDDVELYYGGTLIETKKVSMF